MPDNGNKTVSDGRITQTGEAREADLAQVGEIEVTEKMVAAGRDVLGSKYDPRDWDQREVVKEIYETMELVRRSGRVEQRID